MKETSPKSACRLTNCREKQEQDHQKREKQEQDHQGGSPSPCDQQNHHHHRDLEQDQTCSWRKEPCRGRL